MTKVTYAVLAVALAALIYGGVQGRHADQWHQRAADALAISAAQRDTIAAIRTEAARNAQDASKAQAHADTALRVIQSLRDALGLLHGHSTALIAQAPDTCKPVIAALSAERDTALAVADSTRAALADADSSANGFHRAYIVAIRGLDLAQGRGDSLAAVLKAAPGPCRLFGVPCPVLSVGAVFGPSGGVQPGVSVGFPIRF